jgi:hypothetical protein
MNKPMKVQPKMCATCPWRKGSPYAHLRSTLELSAMTQASRICHSTGSNNVINRRTGQPEKICRGARDVQLDMLHKLNFLTEPTDAAWDAKVRELKLP